MNKKDNRIPDEEIQRQKTILKKIKTINGRTERKFKINTYGCQMNENDSEKLCGMLVYAGYKEVSDECESDLILFNTCCVRENAELKVLGHLGRIKKLKKDKPSLIVIVCGCMMQQPEIVKTIQDKYKQVDIVFGINNLYKFPEMLYDFYLTNEKMFKISETNDLVCENLPIQRKDSNKAWVSISYGCDNYCTYCVVPYVRGRERSRRIEDIVDEVKMLARNNIREITLLGQNVNSYGKEFGENYNFSKLLKKVAEIDGIIRIRFMTSHPKDLSKELIEVINESKKICNHIHLPIQSGSTKILKEMNRKYTKEQYLKLVETIRDNISDVSLTTDIIVGFPGETDEDFNETLDLIEKVRFDFAYTFIYSKRKGTPAAEISNQISETVKNERFQKLLKIQNIISRELNQKLLGTEQEILVEGLSRNNDEMLTGRTQTNKIVNFAGKQSQIGKIVKVKIEKIQTWSLEGKQIKNNES